MSIVSLILLAVLPVQVESARFTILVNGEEVGTEEFTIEQSGDGFLARGRTRLEVDGQTIDVQSRMELDGDLNPISYEYRSAERVVRTEITDLFTEVQIIADGQTTPYDIRFPSDGVIIDDNFFHHHLLLLYRVGDLGGTVPVFVPQQMTLGGLQVRPAGDRTFELESQNLRLRATTDEDGRMIRLVLLDSDVVVER